MQKITQRMREQRLEDAKRIAAQPITDRLEGKQGEEAKTAILALLEMAGLDYVEGLHLVSALEWDRWGAGWRQARDLYTAEES